MNSCTHISIKRLIVLFLFLSSIGAGYSQPRDFVSSKSFEKWDQLRLARAKRNPSELYYEKINRTFEITPHVLIVGNDTIISRKDIDLLLNAVNKYYEPIGVSFTTCSVKYFRGTALDTVSFAWWDTNVNDYLSKEYEPYTINMYFLKAIKTGTPARVPSFESAGIAQMPTVDPKYMSDYVFIAEKGFSRSVIGHELGHFLGLYHPHETSNGLELVNETNCATAGDFMCDTPAEPGESLLKLVDDDCHYTGNITAHIIDPNGEGYVPSTTNVMSYVPEACVKGFTKEQFERMVTIYYQFKTYLR